MNQKPTKTTPVYRNKLWLSGNNTQTLKNMDNRHVIAAVNILKNNKGKDLNFLNSNRVASFTQEIDSINCNEGIDGSVHVTVTLGKKSISFEDNKVVSNVATLQDLKDELDYRERLVNTLFKRVHVYNDFRVRQNQPCKFLGETKPSCFTTKGINVR